MSIPHEYKFSVHYTSRREMRHALASGKDSPPDMTCASNFAKLESTAYSSGSDDSTPIVKLCTDGTVVIDKRAYVDDVVAFLAGAIKSNPTIAPEIKAHLTRFVDAMDARAVARHGYSESPREAAFEWTSVTPTA